MDDGFNLFIIFTVTILTVIFLPILRYGFTASLFNAGIVRKLGHLNGTLDANTTFHIEIVELKAANDEIKVGMQISRTYRKAFSRGKRKTGYTLTKEEAVEFARILRKTANAS